MPSPATSASSTAASSSYPELFQPVRSESSDGGSGGLDSPLYRQQQQQQLLNIVGPPERSPTLDGSRQRHTETSSSGPSAAALSRESMEARLQMRRISRLNAGPPPPNSSVSIAPVRGGGDGIFEESVQRVTLAVDEVAGGGEAGVGGSGGHHHMADVGGEPASRQRQQDDDEEDMMEDLMREIFMDDDAAQRRQVGLFLFGFSHDTKIWSFLKCKY